MHHSLRDAPGTLWERLHTATAYALRTGALEPIETRAERVPDGGMTFSVRIVSSLARKAQAAKQSKGAPSPLWPYEQDLYVSDVDPAHVAILNKYNVLAHHLLLLTREPADQQQWLTRGDFEVLLRCLREFDSLGFYNAGKTAGASQARKHLQLVPLPLDAATGLAVPVEALMPSVQWAGEIGRIPQFEFVHALARLEHAWLDDPVAGAGHVYERYRRLVHAVGLSKREDNLTGHSDPYNLIATDRWMLIVPRARERYGPIGVNALGYAGALLARDEADLQAIKDIGPMAILKGVSIGS